jgi:polynucleotide 5'-hydroxyl-kinase GRC3/NOL9
MLKVSSGAVTIYGANLKASDQKYQVHAPSCYALPVIRCPEGAEIELQACPEACGLRNLQDLSPHFRHIWIEESSTAPKSSNGRTRELKTFEIVRASQ